MIFLLAPLPYAYDALEPYIDARTMEIHYTKHHQGYVDNLNKALEAYPTLHKKLLSELLQLSEFPDEVLSDAIMNYGGGHWNHTFFWSLMKHNGGGEPVGLLRDQLINTFGSYSLFKEQFSAAAKKVFGSGWVWLVVDTQGALKIVSTANQGCPLVQHLNPVLGLDVWEHAYYLHYQNRRADYIEAWWKVLNWERIEEHYRTIIGR